MAKILLVDIETAPKLAYVWKFFKENISPKQVKEHGHIMCYAAKWLGDDEVLYDYNLNAEDDKDITQSLLDLLHEADIAVAHNGDRFDYPSIMARALVHGLSPPSPFKTVDTLKVARFEFKFPSNSLEYLAKVLECKSTKMVDRKYSGFKLWTECLSGNDEAWDEMVEYCIQDVNVLEEVYLKMRPWMSRHPNIASIDEHEGHSCPKCGSVHVQKRGFAYTNTGKYQRFSCNDCGGWSRSRYTLRTNKEQLVNQVN